MKTAEIKTGKKEDCNIYWDRESAGVEDFLVSQKNPT